MLNKIYRLAALLGWLATVTGQAQNMPTPPIYGALTNNNVGNVTFKHALTIGSGTAADILTVNGGISQTYGVGVIANAFNNGTWSDNGSGTINCVGLNTGTLYSHSIQNANGFNSDGGSFYSDGGGNVSVNTLASQGTITADSLSAGPSTFGTISSDINAIYSDGAGTLYANIFSGSFNGTLNGNINGSAAGAIYTFSSGISSTPDKPINATGVTNTGTRFCTAVLTAAATTFWITNQFGLPVGTNTTFTGTIALPLAPSASIHAASGLSGYCYY